MRLRRVIASNIRRFARDEEIALNHLADQADVSRSQLYAVLAAEQSPTIDWLAKVSGPLRVEPWQLLKKWTEG